MKFPDAARLTRLRFGLLAAVLAVVGLFAATAQIASASPSRAATGPKPTIVLGAWRVGRFRQLERRGPAPAA